MQESREEYLTSSWKAWSANAAREYRCGFEDGMANKNISGMPYMSDAYLDGFATGAELFQKDYEASAAGQTAFNDEVSYEEMAKGA